jgi:hypothetical protein
VTLESLTEAERRTALEAARWLVARRVAELSSESALLVARLALELDAQPRPRALVAVPKAVGTAG